MVVTFRHLVGARENLDITLLGHIIDNWDDTKTNTITQLP